MSEDIGLSAGTSIVIIRPTRKLQHFNGNNLVKTYPVALGKESTPTPLGDYKVINKILNPGNMLGTRWMGLSIPDGNYGIHGTDNPSSIGKFISHGCIRMFNHDVEELFPQVTMGTPVTIADGAGVAGSAVPSEKNSPQQLTGRKIYFVRQGDTLWKISREQGVPLDVLISANNITDPDVLVPGQTIIIP